LRTTNAGITWTRESTPTTNNLKGISIINGRTGWAVGSNGIVLRRGDFSGVQKISSEIPTAFELLPNYPNPFNQSTIINFQLSITSDVTLTIFDVLGKKVAELLTQTRLGAGIYRTSWTANNYSSGVYLCKLQAGGFITYRKLVLLQ
jgi:hypothetical protein